MPFPVFIAECAVVLAVVVQSPPEVVLALAVAIDVELVAVLVLAVLVLVLVVELVAAKMLNC